MNYKPNETTWKIGDLVIHDADQKSERYLMRVVETRHDGQIKTEYANRTGNERYYWNRKDVLHDPVRFGIDTATAPTPPPPVLSEIVSCAVVELAEIRDLIHECERLILKHRNDFALTQSLKMFRSREYSLIAEIKRNNQ